MLASRRSLRQSTGYAGPHGRTTGELPIGCSNVVVPLEDTDTCGDDGFAMLTLTVVVQLNCTRPCTPLLSIRKPPVVRSVETESPPVPPVGTENKSSMPVSK